ncbi:hypothetical protein IWQ61_004707 [Dispira simplex]|nr:hypothetical protein IWQ61_004707 [Dispira simplex]
MTTPKADNKQKNTDEKKSQVEKDEDIDPRDNTSEESGGKVDLAAEAKKPFDSMGGVPIFDDNRGTFSEGYNSITERAANQYNQLIIGN